MSALSGDYNYCNDCGECSDEEMKEFPIELCEV
jgi:hypothetical protein